MTGFERNADVVRIATYAPLFAHVEGWQWRPDLIWYDNVRSVRSCSYYVQQLFSLNKTTNSLKLTMNGKPVNGKNDQEDLFASSVWDENNKQFIVKVVNTKNAKQTISIEFNGLGDEVILTNCQKNDIQFR